MRENLKTAAYIFTGSIIQIGRTNTYISIYKHHKNSIFKKTVCLTPVRLQKDESDKSERVLYLSIKEKVMWECKNYTPKIAKIIILSKEVSFTTQIKV